MELVLTLEETIGVSDGSEEYPAAYQTVDEGIGVGDAVGLWPGIFQTIDEGISVWRLDGRLTSLTISGPSLLQSPDGQDMYRDTHSD